MLKSYFSFGHDLGLRNVLNPNSDYTAFFFVICPSSSYDIFPGFLFNVDQYEQRGIAKQSIKKCIIISIKTFCLFIMCALKPM